jgi:NAD(P)-dependent dehydrogenase (short-subunit alcohol dehydrogenase family)
VIDDLSTSVAVVTGGASGIGRSAAEALSDEGVRVVLADVHDERLGEVEAQINDSGGMAIAHHCDVSRDEDLRSLHQLALERFGRVDIVMNNVGVLALGQPEAIPIEAWQRVIDTNLLSVVRSIRTFLPEMLQRKSGHFVNTASTAGLWAYAADRLPYSASKAAVIAVSEALVLHCRSRGVGVTCLCPGPVHTNIAEQVQVFGDLAPMQAPPLPMIEPETIGPIVVDAIRANRFLVPTHPEVLAILQKRAADPDAFVAAQAQRLDKWE